MIEPINMGHNARNFIVYDCVILTACNGNIFVDMQLNAIMLPDKLDAYNEIVRLAFRKKYESWIMWIKNERMRPFKLYYLALIWNRWPRQRVKQ